MTISRVYFIFRMFGVNLFLNLRYSLNRLLMATTKKSQVIQLLQKLHPRVPVKPLIRMGKQGDGGYLLPDDLEGIEACFSPGIGDSSVFELQLANKGIKVFMADASVKGPMEDHALFHFDPQFIGTENKRNFISLDSWIKEKDLNSNSDLLLQMDIEGFEYDVISNISEAVLKRFRIIIVEFHRVDKLWSRHSFDRINRCFEKLLKHHQCVHNHPNNQGGIVKFNGIGIPRTTEITFVRKERCTDELANQFPHPLDSDNIFFPHVTLPKHWHS